MYLVRGNHPFDIAMDIGIAGLFASWLVGFLAAGAGLTTIAHYAIVALLASCLIALIPLWVGILYLAVMAVSALIIPIAKRARL